MDKILQKAKSFPESPGIYKFISKEKIVYVGKSKNLRKRVTSYFKEGDNRRKIFLMMKLVDNVEIELTNTDLEAKVLEYQMIHALKPIYNSQYKYDKSPFYLKINNSKDILTVSKDGEIGPFLGDKFIRLFLEGFEKLFPIKYENNDFKFSYHILKEKLSEYEIKETVFSIKHLFSKKENIENFILRLKEFMEMASNEFKFEKSQYYFTMINNFKFIIKNIFNKREFFNNKYIFQEGNHLIFIKNGEIMLKDNSGNFDLFSKKCLKISDDQWKCKNYSDELKTIIFNATLSDKNHLYHIQ